MIFCLAFAFSANAETGDRDPLGNSSGKVCIKALTYDMRVASRDITTANQVSDLQLFLQAKGYLNSEPTGYFGLMTFAAIQSYQAANGITPVSGFVGPITRGKINASGCVSVSSPASDQTPDPEEDEDAVSIDSISPSSADGGEKVTIKGKNLKSGMYVNFLKSSGSQVAYVYNTRASNSGKTLYFTFDERIALNAESGTYKVSVSEDKNGDRSNSLDFTIEEPEEEDEEEEDNEDEDNDEEENDTLSISSVSPSSSAGGETIIIKGENLKSGMTVNLFQRERVVSSSVKTTASSDGKTLYYDFDARIALNSDPGLYQINVSDGPSKHSNQLDFTIESE